MLLSCLLLSLMISCKKEDKKSAGSGSGSYGKGFYVVGDEAVDYGQAGKVWKDGKLIFSYGSGDTFVAFSGVFVSNADELFVSGWQVVEGKTIPMYWKNGVAVSLAVPGYRITPRCIYKSESGDLYIAGQYESDSYEVGTTVWKNGVPTHFPNIETPGGFLVSGADVYLNCISVDPVSGVSSPAFLKDGKIVPLPTGAKSVVSTIGSFRNGSDEYSAKLVSASGFKNSVEIFKNGSFLKELSAPMTGAYVEEIFVKDGSFYLAGNTGEGFGRSATCWTDSGVVLLSSGNVRAECTGIFVK